MTLKINGATGGSVSLDAPDNTSPAGTDVTLTLPVNDGDAGQYLQTDGTGTLSWQTVTVPTSFDNIVEGNTTVECVDTGSDGHITFDTEGTERARIDSAGRLLVGTTSSPTGVGDLIQSMGTTGNQIGLGKFSSDTRGPYFDFYKSRGTLGNHGLVSNGDEAGQIIFNGSDSAFYRDCARIEAWIDGTATTGGAMPGRLVFATTANGATSATERMRITRSGNLCINSDGSDNSTGGPLCITGRSSQGMSTWNIGTNGLPALYFNNASGTKVGDIVVNSGSTAYNTSSDYRLKENVVDLDGAIDRVKQLAPKRFNFIVDADRTVDGFLAHEAQAVVPEAVTGTQDQVEVWKEGDELPDGVSVGDNKLDEEGNTLPVYQGIDQSKLVPLLTAALQEAIAKIETLETRLTALEGGAA